MCIRDSGYNLGGEQSGHIILSDFATTGDGLIAALQVLSLVVSEGKPVSEVCQRFDPVPQLLKNVSYSGASPLRVPSVTDAITAQEQRLGDTGRLVIRPSGTEPLIRIMAEGDDDDLVNDVVDQLVGVIETAAAHESAQ